MRGCLGSRKELRTRTATHGPGEPARYLLATTPKLIALGQALHEPAACDYAAIFRAHDSELLS